MPSIPIQTATVSTLSAPVTRTLWSSSTVSTTPTAGLMRRSTSSAGASTAMRQWTVHPVDATCRRTNAE